MIRVLLVSRDAVKIEEYRKYIKEDEELDLEGSETSYDSALEKVENSSPDILLISCIAPDSDSLSLAERVILKKPKTFVMMLLPEITLDVLSSANSVGCHHVYPFPEDAGELNSVIHRVYQSESGRIAALNSNESVTWSSRIITVFGAKGGLGKTTIACNLAVSLAHMNKKVAIVDLDLQFGDVHIFLDTDPKETIADLMQDTSEPTIDTIRSYMSIHPSGVHILAAPRSPEYADLVSADKLQTVLALLRSSYDYVIVDTTSNFTDPILTALEASSIVLFLTGLDVSILKNSKAAMSILDSLGLKKKVRAVINRAVEINSISIADVQRIVDAPILSRIPSDYMMAVAALNRGQPFVESAPKAKLSLALTDLAERIAAGADNFDLQQLSPRERRALMRKFQTKDRSEKRGLFRKH